MSYQKTVVCGHIGQAATVRKTASGATAIGFSVAVNRKYADGNGVEVEETTWFNCTKWVGKDGSSEVAKWLLPGTVVLVDGTMSAHAFKDKQKELHASLDLRVDRLQLVSSKNN